MAVGAAVGSFTDSAPAAALLGLLSHVPLDVLPHYEFDKMWVEATFVSAVFVAMLASGMGRTGIFWGALAAAAPDIENLLWKTGILPGEKKVFPGHSHRWSRLLQHGRSLGPRHALTQLGIIFASLAIVFLSMQ
jgi:hypothetical protein